MNAPVAPVCMARALTTSMATRARVLTATQAVNVKVSRKSFCMCPVCLFYHKRLFRHFHQLVFICLFLVTHSEQRRHFFIFCQCFKYNSNMHCLQLTSTNAPAALVFTARAPTTSTATRARAILATKASDATVSTR